MKVLVLGRNGQLGLCLTDQLLKTDYYVTCAARDQIDMADFKDTEAKIRYIAPDVVINATAYTAVDKAEKEQASADLINNLAVSNLANICTNLDCWLIHFSTDYVFDGASNHPYKEGDQVNPQGVYGETKLAGERVIQRVMHKYLIVRTAWVFSEYRENFLKTMVSICGVRDELNIVDDQIGCPTYAQDLAKSVITILSFIERRSAVPGLYHYCGDSPCSWYEFAKAIFQEAEKNGFCVPNILNPIPSSKYVTLAKRPSYSVLDSSKISQNFDLETSDWRSGIKKVFTRIHM